MKAEFVRELPRKDWTGIAKLYRLSEPVAMHSWDDSPGQTYGYVIASATVVRYGGRPETYLFASDANGEPLSWAELPGSLNDTLNHDAAIAEFVRVHS